MSPDPAVSADHLVELARSGRTAELVAAVQAGADVDTTDAAGNSLLVFASYRGHADTTQALLDLGADPDRPNANRQTALAGVVFKGADACLAPLLAAGADPDAGQPSARTIAGMTGRDHLFG